jgi:hypothetical protein
MTPEKREELKAMALAVDDPKQRGFDTRSRFVAYAQPSAILSLIAQIEGLNRKNLELQRVYDERGLQIGRLETALQRATKGAKP